jgi:hypothetical protein
MTTWRKQLLKSAGRGARRPPRNDNHLTGHLVERYSSVRLRPLGPRQVICGQGKELSVIASYHLLPLISVISPSLREVKVEVEVKQNS